MYNHFAVICYIRIHINKFVNNMTHSDSSKLRGQMAVGVTIKKIDKDPVDPE